MKRFIIFLMAVLACTNAANAYNPDDLKRFSETGKCNGCDLSGAYLRDVVNSLMSKNKKIELVGADLKNAHLSGANLARANLYRANLYRTNLTKTNLTETNLIGTELMVANLNRANLNRANLLEANLAQTNFSGANLEKTQFGPLDLTYGTNFEGSNLYAAKFTLPESSRPLYEKYKASLSWPAKIGLRLGSLLGLYKNN